MTHAARNAALAAARDTAEHVPLHYAETIVAQVHLWADAFSPIETAAEIYHHALSLADDWQKRRDELWPLHLTPERAEEIRDAEQMRDTFQAFAHRLAGLGLATLDNTTDPDPYKIVTPEELAVTYEAAYRPPQEKERVQ